MRWRAKSLEPASVSRLSAFSRRRRCSTRHATARPAHCWQPASAAAVERPAQRTAHRAAIPAQLQNGCLIAGKVRAVARPLLARWQNDQSALGRRCRRGELRPNPRAAARAEQCPQRTSADGQLPASNPSTADHAAPTTRRAKDRPPSQTAFSAFPHVGAEHGRTPDSVGTGTAASRTRRRLGRMQREDRAPEEDPPGRSETPTVQIRLDRKGKAPAMEGTRIAGIRWENPPGISASSRADGP